MQHVLSKSNICWLLVLFGLFTHSLGASNKKLGFKNINSRDSIVVKGPYKYSQMSIIAEMAKSFCEMQKIPSNKFTVGWDKHASFDRFFDKDQPFDILVCNITPKIFFDKFQKQLPAANSKLSDYFLIGQIRILVIANKNNIISKISFDEIQKLLHSKNMNGKVLGHSFSKIICLGEDKNSFAIEVLKRRCMAYYEEKNKFQGWRDFRPDFEYLDAEKIITEVKKNPDSIGFLQYQPKLNKLLKYVKILAVSHTEAGPFVQPIPAMIIQEEYPLYEPVVMYLHSRTPSLAKEFCEFAVGPEGAKIAAKFGLITPYAEKQYLAEKYVKMMKAGEGPSVGMTGSVNLRDLAKGLILESVKSNGPVQFKYTHASETTAVNSFLNRDDVYMMLLDSPPSERTMKYVESSWKKIKPVEHIIGGEALAIIVNPANTAKSLTPDQVRGLFSRQVKDWRLVAAKTAESGGNSRVECFGERLNTPAAKLFMDTVMPSRKISGVKYRKTAGGVIASVAIDAGGVGFANAALIDPEDKAIKILPIGLLGKAVLPTDETIINGQYPFNRKLYLYVKPNAPEAVKAIVKFLLSSEAAEAFKTNGYFPAPQPKPKPVPKAKPTKKHKTNKATPVKATKHPTTKPTKPTAPAATQPVKKAS